MAEEQNKKRKAEEQLSPYSRDPEDLQPAKLEKTGTQNPLPRKARARRNRDTPVPSGKMKGIFGKVSLSTDGGRLQQPKSGTGAGRAENPPKNTNDLVAGINRSFLKALNCVIEKQANKDLTYLFRQYEDFISFAKKGARK